MNYMEESYDILREFVSDVRAAGEAHVKEEWPDIFVTFTRAKELLALQRKGLV